jgi:uncharacterized protein YegP (UPF0339 family)
MEGYKQLRPGESPVGAHFMIFFRPTNPPYYGWWLKNSNGEVLCTSDEFQTMAECERNLEQVRGTALNADVYYAPE